MADEYFYPAVSKDEECIDQVTILKEDKRIPILEEQIQIGDQIPYYGKVFEKNDKHIIFEDSMGKKTKIKKNSTSWTSIFKELSGLLSMSASLSPKQYGDIVKIASRSKKIKFTDSGTVMVID